MRHTPVLLDETLVALVTVPDGNYVDATWGRGGHGRALLARLGAKARLLALDRDADAIADAEQLAREEPRVLVERACFSSLAAVVERHGLAPLAGALMDVGVSSPQLEDAGRGFSLLRDGPLDMRMDTRAGPTAAQWLNGADAGELARAFRRLGGERAAVRIAREVVARRPLERTGELAAAVAAAAGGRDAARHVATRVFQAVRIAVNDELSELDAGLDAAFDSLGIGGRLAVVTFHSLEHRMVRRRFRAWHGGDAALRRVPAKGEPASRARLVVRGARPNDAEIGRNPRARSAMLQVVEKCA